jgi:NADH-quinone oxidoreductase subunit C
MQAKAIFDRLAAKLGDAVYELTEAGAKDGPKDPFCKVKPGSLLEVAKVLRDEPELRFDFLNNVTAVDWIKQDILQVVYHVWSYTHFHEFIVKVDLPRKEPVVPSLVSIWPGANWLEREQFDLLGVLFEGHPDLRRILMPDDWDGHPMRKDYKEAAEYRGMPTTRYSPLELLVAYDKANPQTEGARPVGKGGKGED